jgi:hypothetical protein
MKKTTKKQILSLFILIAFIGSSITFALLNTFSTQNPEDVWVARISIVIFEELQTIPADVGVYNNTKDKLYTIAADNLVYKNTDEDVMLKDFFEIWEENFNYTCILEHCNNENNTMRMYVNSLENFDYELYTIKDKDHVIIDYR